MDVEILLKKTYKELYQLAVEKNITGRSTLNKQALAMVLRDPPKKEEGRDVFMGIALREKMKQPGVYGGINNYYYNNCQDGIGSFCYARLGNLGVPLKEIFIDIIYHYNRHEDKEAYKEWVLWMLNDSPYAPLFHTKTWEEVETSCVHVNTAHPFSDIIAACTALRQGNEFPTKIKTWKALEKYNLSPRVRWFVAYSHMYNPDNQTFATSGMRSGHEELHRKMSFTGLIKFFKEGFYMNKGLPFACDVPAWGYAVYDSICRGNDLYHQKKRLEKEEKSFEDWEKDNKFESVNTGNGFNVSFRIPPDRFQAKLDALQVLIN